MNKMKRVELANGRVSYEAKRSAKLVQPLSEQTFTNANGTEYKLCTISVDGIQATAMVYSGNYNHADANFTVGNSYSAKASTVWDEETQAPKRDENGTPLIMWTLSHLPTASISTAAMFGFELEDAEEFAL